MGITVRGYGCIITEAFVGQCMLLGSYSWKHDHTLESEQLTCLSACI